MKENVLDVLIYLFENYLVEESDPQPDQEALAVELHDAGFRNHEIDRAFDWLESLSELCDEIRSSIDEPAPKSVRVLTADEARRLGPEGHGFLLEMEQLGILDARSRELLIDRIMALHLEETSLDQLKWVTMIVLTNCNGDSDDFYWIEDLLFDDMTPSLH